LLIDSLAVVAISGTYLTAIPQLARYMYFGLQYSPAVAALFPGIANRLASWVAISADIANSHPITRHA